MVALTYIQDRLRWGIGQSGNGEACWGNAAILIGMESCIVGERLCLREHLLLLRTEHSKMWYSSHVHLESVKDLIWWTNGYVVCNWLSLRTPWPLILGVVKFRGCNRCRGKHFLRKWYFYSFDELMHVVAIHAPKLLINVRYPSPIDSFNRCIFAALGLRQLQIIETLEVA